MFPPNPVGRHRILRRRNLFAGTAGQCCEDLIRIGRLRQIVDCAELNSVHSSCDIAVSGENDGARIGTARTNSFYDVEAVAVAEAHIHDRIGRGGGLGGSNAFLNRFRSCHLKTPTLHGAGKALQKGLVVINQKEGRIVAYGFGVFLLQVVHRVLPACIFLSLLIPLRQKVK